MHLELKPSELWLLASSVNPLKKKKKTEDVHFPVGCRQCCRKIKQKGGTREASQLPHRVRYVLHVERAFAAPLLDHMKSCTPVQFGFFFFFFFK